MYESNRRSNIIIIVGGLKTSIDRLGEIDEEIGGLSSHNARLKSVEENVERNRPYSRLIRHETNAREWHVYEQRDERETRRSNLSWIFTQLILTIQIISFYFHLLVALDVALEVLATKIR